jgi:F-type H+-transporting ATPase subunit gamma
MANLKEIRNRITSVESTMQITSAMKMVSAAKLKQATDSVIQMRPYAEKFNEILSNVSSSLDSSENKLVNVREEKKILVVALASNRGLCGGFNNNVAKKVRKIIEKYGADTISILPIGRKIADILKSCETSKLNENIPNELSNVWDNLTFDKAVPLADNLMTRFINGDYDKIILVYNTFKNAAVQNLTTEQFLPIVPDENNEKKTQAIDYIFEPSQGEIVENIIPDSLKIKLYKAMLESMASEHGARMTAMHKATDNASEMKKELLLFYNKARQAAITNEILEIVGGAEALDG